MHVRHSHHRFQPLRIGFLIFVSMICSGIVAAQYFNPIFQNFSINNGLPSSEVYDAIQDQQGYLWMATDRGLCRYDGYSFERFDLKDGLTDLVIFHFFEDLDGRIWCMTYNHNVFHFDPQLLDFTPYQYNEAIQKVGDQHGVITSFHKTPQNEIYLGFQRQNGYMRIDADGNAEIIDNLKFGAFITLRNLPDGIPISYFYRGGKQYADYIYSCDSLHVWSGNQELTIAWDEDNCIAGKHLFGQNDQVYNLLQNSLLVSSPDTFFRIRFDAMPISISQTASGDVWVGFLGGGVQRINFDSPHTSELFLPELSITRVLNDHEGGLWFTSLENGLYYARSLDVRAVATNVPRNHKVIDVVAPNSEYLYISYYNNQVMRIHRSGRSAEEQVFMGQHYPRLRHSFTPGEVLIADYNSFYAYGEQGIRLIHNYHGRFIIEVVAQVIHNGVLAALDRHSILLISPDSAVSNRIELPARYRSIHSQADGTIMIGTLAGLFTYKDSLQALGKQHPLLRTRIECITEQGNAIVVGTLGSGVVYYSEDSVFNITRSQGLASDVVHQILVENDSVLWVATNQGLSRVSRHGSNAQILNIDFQNGLLSNEVTAIDLKNDTLWVGTRNGVCLLPVEHLVLKRTAPKLQFYQLQINGESIDASEQLELEYNDQLSISYLGISFQEGDQLEYRYQMAGLDTTWYSTNDRLLRYASLPPGEYRFLLNAVVNNQLWLDQPLELQLKVATPFWQRWWFFAAVLILTFGLSYLIIRLRYQRKSAQQAVQSHIQELEMKALKAQINPHFTFNTINSIQHFILNNDPWTAQSYLAKFAKLIRKTLEFSDRETVLLSEELSLLKMYLEFEQLRFDTPFTFSIEAAPEVDLHSYKVPPMIFQPFVENAIWHGFAPRNGEGHLEIALNSKGSAILCTILDNGVGRPTHDSPSSKHGMMKKSMGIQITRDRLKLFNTELDESLNINIQDLKAENDQPAGTKVTVRLQQKTAPKTVA